MKPDYPFGSCQYDTVYKHFTEQLDNPELKNAKPRTGFTKEIVILLLTAHSDASHDLWSCASDVAALAIENWPDIDELLPFDGDYDPQTGIACAALVVAFGLTYDDFPQFDT